MQVGSLPLVPSPETTVVLDDDPTGTQAMRDVTVVLRWHDHEIERIPGQERSLHVLTNSRSLTGPGAAEVVESAARASIRARPAARVILRGDSTLRGHLVEEYEALRLVIAPHATPPLLLVPALPTAGRVTVAGVHSLRQDGRLVPLHLTEYAADGALSYGDSTLVRWAEERSAGRFRADDGVEVGLGPLREQGAPVVAAAIEAASVHGRPAVVAPDAETDADLESIAAGLRLAEAAGRRPIVRCAPAFAAILTGTRAESFVPPPSPAAGVLVLCGSFVSATTAQLEELERAHPGTSVTAGVAPLAGDGAEAEISRLAGAASSLLARGRLAVIATERSRDPDLVDASAQRRIAEALATVADRVPAGVLIAKGGITAAVTASHGLHAATARVIGPLLPGVSYWRLDRGQSYVVVPGNVGDARLLADLVDLLVGGSRP
jgi:uncharacterized protein YgbK (DUF1537 family)